MGQMNDADREALYLSTLLFRASALERNCAAAERWAGMRRLMWRLA